MVRAYLIKYTHKLGLPLFFVANRIIPAEGAFDNFKMIVCEETSQAADNRILQDSAEYDIVVTRDIPLAAALLKKNIRVMNDRGILFTNENIERRLKERDLNIQMSGLGLGTRKKSSYGKKEFAEFTKCFDREIHKLI